MGAATFSGLGHSLDRQSIAFGKKDGSPDHGAKAPAGDDADPIKRYRIRR
jgi:hypothetical protein